MSRRGKRTPPPPEWWERVASKAAWRELVRVMAPVGRATTTEHKRKAMRRALPLVIELLDRHEARLDDELMRTAVVTQLAELGDMAVAFASPTCPCPRCLEVSYRASETHQTGALALSVID